MARTDSEKTPAMRLNDLRREWGLKSSDEATAQAQNKALEPLSEWLRSGEESPEVIVRAVQVLLADPELSDVDRRPAVETVIHQVSEIWANAGLEAQGMLGLQAMLLAAWPYDLTYGGFALPPFFDSAWEVMRGRARQRTQLNAWRNQLPLPGAEADSVQDVGLEAPTVSVSSPEIPFSEPDPNLQHLQVFKDSNAYFSHIGKQLIDILEGHRRGLAILDNRTKSTIKVASAAITRLVSQLGPALTASLTQSRTMSNFLWWGQSRYSQAARRPYRRIENATERLWWMAWEASEIARGLAVDPAASFLVETLYQVEGKADDQKRPLKDWLGELIPVLRSLQQNRQHTEILTLSEPLRELATEDALGLPVTWARLEAENPKGQGSDIWERAREALALDLDAPISRGDWAAWLFREALLDRHLQDKQDEED